MDIYYTAPYTMGVSTVRYTYRLRVGRTAEDALMSEWHRVRFVWNVCVAAFRDKRPSSNKELSRELTKLRREHEWLRDGSVVPQQQAVRDFVRARDRFFDSVKAGKRVGRPRFKSRKKSLPSLQYTVRGFSLKDGRLHLAKGISLRVVWSRDLPSTPSSVRVYRDACGSWWASFVVERDDVQRHRTGDGDVGFDFGITTTATATNPDYDLEFSSATQAHARKVRRHQRRMARFRREKDAERLRKARQDYAKAQRRIRRQRQERLRRFSQTVARNHARVAVEDLKPGFMSKTTLSRKMHDAAIATLRRELVDACASLGTELIAVDPSYTTMTCSCCGVRATSRLPLSLRTFTCAQCGFVCDRDRNAARNVALRAGLNPDSMMAPKDAALVAADVAGSERGIPRL